jgi:hypothetical protein
MTKQTLRNFTLALGLLGLALIPYTSVAQAAHGSKLPGKNAASAAARAESPRRQTPGSPSYAYTLLSYPGTFYTTAVGINPGATTSKKEIVGTYSAPSDPDGGYGFLAHVSGTKTVAESYAAVKYPRGALVEYPLGVNDSGEIVGTYEDGSGVFHGFELSGARLTALNVPFAGAVETDTEGLNNSGEIVGAWTDSGGNTHGLTLIGGNYASFDYPGGYFTYAEGVNSAGEIVGYYIDGIGSHGFLLSGGTYTSIDFPGAGGTGSSGINDAGDIVGIYCATSECDSSGAGVQSYVLSGGVFTTVAIPGEVSTTLSDINNNGVLVGFYQDAAGLFVSFLATP